MTRHLDPRTTSPTRTRRRLRPELDRLEDRLQPNNLGGVGADLALDLRQVARPRTTELAPARDHHAHAGRARQERRAASRPGHPVPSNARVPLSPPRATRSMVSAAAATLSPQIQSAGAKPPGPVTPWVPILTVSSSFTADGGYTLSQWGPGGSIAYGGIAMGTLPGTSTPVIVTAGRVNNSNGNNIAVARYKTDGTFDTTYGSGGVSTNASIAYSQLNAMALKPDGTVVGAGSNAVARYTPQGAPDTTFNGTGWVSTDLGAKEGYSGYGVGFQATGKIVVAGWTRLSNPSGTYPVIARYTAAGKLDAGAGGFGQPGKNGAPQGYRILPTGPSMGSELYALAVQPDDRIVTVGRTYDSNLNLVQATLARFTPDGNPDPTFNGGNTVLFSQGATSRAQGFAVALQADGKIVVAGKTSMGGTDGGGFLAARFNPDGSLDPTFNNGSGSIRVDIPSATGIAEAHALAIDGVGRIVIGGKWGRAVNGTNVYGVAAARLNPDGTPDASFGTGGIKTLTLPNDTGTWVSGVAIGGDGSYYLAGSVTPPSGSQSTLLVHFLP